MIMDYEYVDIDAIYDVAKLFGLDLPARETYSMKAVFEKYSKDPAATQPFVPDRVDKRRRATDAIKRHADRKRQSKPS